MFNAYLVSLRCAYLTFVKQISDLPMILNLLDLLIVLELLNTFPETNAE